MKNFKVKSLNKNELPEELKQIPSPPEKIHYIGEIPDMKKYIYISIVGSRNPDIYAKQALENIMESLSGYPVVVVSGLAIGTDALAHKLAIKNKIKTIAVPGSGLSKKVLYPKSNFSLAMEILNSGGALLSEFDFEQSAAPWTFPRRNRIMAGISKLTFVVQAKERSGTLITANLALEYGKDVCALPARVYDENFKGNLKLIKQGAYLVESADDILQLLNLQKIEYKTKCDTSELSENEIKLLEFLSEAKDKNEVLESLDIPVSEILITINKLQIRGLIDEKYGKLYKKI